MDSLKLWLVKYSVGTHVVAVCAFLVAAFDEIQPFHDAVMQVYYSLPPAFVKWIAISFMLYAWYRKGEPKTFTPENVVKLKVWALVSLLLIGMMPLTGCTISASQISADGNAIAKACESIAAIEATVDPQLANNLLIAANGLASLASTWTSGSSIAYFNDAASAVEIALAAIPQTAAIAPLIPIAVAAIDLLIANSSSSTPSASVSARQVSFNPYRGKAQVHHRMFRSPEGDFKAAWDSAIASNPGLASAKL